MHVRTDNGLMTSGGGCRLGNSWPEAQYRVFQDAYQELFSKSYLEAYTER